MRKRELPIAAAGKAAADKKPAAAAVEEEEEVYVEKKKKIERHTFFGVVSSGWEVISTAFATALISCGVSSVWGLSAIISRRKRCCAKSFSRSIAKNCSWFSKKPLLPLV